MKYFFDIIIKLKMENIKLNLRRLGLEKFPIPNAEPPAVLCVVQGCLVHHQCALHCYLDNKIKRKYNAILVV